MNAGGGGGRGGGGAGGQGVAGSAMNTDEGATGPCKTLQLARQLKQIWVFFMGGVTVTATWILISKMPTGSVMDSKHVWFVAVETVKHTVKGGRL